MGGWPASALSRPGERRKQCFYVRVQLPADPWGSLRAARRLCWVCMLQSAAQGSLHLCGCGVTTDCCAWAPAREQQERCCCIFLSDKFLWEKHLARSCHVTRQLPGGDELGVRRTQSISPNLLPSGCITHRHCQAAPGLGVHRGIFQSRGFVTKKLLSVQRAVCSQLWCSCSVWRRV